MSLLNTIKDQVARGISKSYADWKDYISDEPFGTSDYAVNEVARRYAKEMVRHNLERAADNAKINASKVSGTVRIKSWALGHGIKLTPSRESILETPIELL